LKHFDVTATRFGMAVILVLPLFGLTPSRGGTAAVDTSSLRTTTSLMQNWRFLHSPGLPQALAATSPPDPPRMGRQRYTEDYSYLRDPAKRSGAWWEPFKFVPLNSQGRFYITAGAGIFDEPAGQQE
jgi:hypothetical protein